MAMVGLAAVAAVPDALDVDDIAPQWSVEAVPGEVPAVPWWETMQDVQLAEIVGQGLAGNPDLDAAYGRLETAEATTLVAFAGLVPNASFDLTTSGQPADVVFRCAVGPISPDEFASLQNNQGDDPSGLCFTGSALFNFRWGLDVFGRGILNHKAARFEAEAARGDQAATRLMISGTIASAYLDAVSGAQQVTILEEQLASQLALLEVLELRYETGGATGLDVLQQRQTVASTRAALPPARLAAASQSRVLAALLGRGIGDLPDLPITLPDPVDAPPIGTPAQLVTRRPDLQAAQGRLVASRARRDAAVRGLLPTVSVNANAGWQYALASELSALGVWGIGGAVSVPLFNGGSGDGQVRQARGTYRATVSAWDTALLNAIRDVENGVVRDFEQAERHDAVSRQVEAARAAFGEARQRYLQGIDSFLSVLAAQSGLQAAELSLVQAHRDRLAARVQLWTALGGDTGVSP
ncbi:MAG: efflux transporter outer membrane subunit [Myxococcota bacterium]